VKAPPCSEARQVFCHRCIRSDNTVAPDRAGGAPLALDAVPSQGQKPQTAWSVAEFEILTFGSEASVELSWHVGFTPDSGRMDATQLNDASGH
jgi:hypothetical protein